MAEHKHRWPVGIQYRPFCMVRGCDARLSGDEIERRLNAFDALVEALEMVQSGLAYPDDAPTITAALRLARGDSEVRA